MNDTVSNLIDDLAEAIRNENAEQARTLISTLGDKYDEVSAEEEKQIRQAALLRENADLTEENEETLAALVSRSADTEMKRGAFLLRAAAAVRNIEQNVAPDDFDEAVSEVKTADEKLDAQITESEPVIEDATIPPSVEIVGLSVISATIGRNQTTKLRMTVANVGDESAERVKIELTPDEGISLSEVEDSLGQVREDEEYTRTYDVEANTIGEQRIRASVSSDNAGTDTSSETLTIEETTRSDLDEYTDQNNIVKLEGLRKAIQDWRRGVISDALLGEVTDAWRTQETVD